MPISNQDNIKSWSNVPRAELESFGDGDFGRVQMLNPAILGLIGNVNGKRIMDAGCGNGYLSRMLAKKGAQVVGVEPGKSMYEFALEKEASSPLGIQYYPYDLSEMDNFKNEFDIVIANMVFMDIPDYKEAIKSCINSLKKDGVLVYSLLHPCFPGFEKDWQEKRQVEIKDYFPEYSVKATYGHVFYRPLQEYINTTNDHGCMTERIIEPQLNEEFAKNNPDLDKSRYVPQFIVVKARRTTPGTA